MKFRIDIVNKLALTKVIFIMSLGLLNTTKSVAQQDAQFTQYMYNTINVNPAYAGSRGVLSVFGIYRAQWVGLEGAPTTSVASLHAPINNSRVGLGISLSKDEIGISDRKTVATDFSYTINTSEDFKLSFGIKGSASLLNVDYTKLNKYDKNDPKFQNKIDRGELAKLNITRGTTPTVRMAMGGLTNVGPRYNMGIMGLNR